MKKIIFHPILFSVVLSGAQSVFAQGSLTPPGTPGPTMKTLQQIEPRTPISSLPFTITNGGAYYLTTNLIGGGSGITIAANGVTLDLMGFELVGGTGSGVNVTGNRTNLCIRNGTIRNWSGSGVDLAGTANGQVLDLTAFSNNIFGIDVGRGYLVQHCVAVGNTTLGGIRAGDGSMVKNCVARSNGGNGISVDGIGSTISACTATLNVGTGIRVNASCHVFDNTCHGNGAGIETGSQGNRIDKNSVTQNGVGIRALSDSNIIIRNTAHLNSVSYQIAAGNAFGPTNNVVGAGVITNLNPWANFSY